MKPYPNGLIILGIVDIICVGVSAGAMLGWIVKLIMGRGEKSAHRLRNEIE